MITGLIVTTMTDMGPYPLLNLSSISEDTTVKLSVIGMTILSMGAGSVAEKQHYRLHGSIPIPDSSNIESLAMSFTVSPTKTNDIRIDQHGRESTIWLLFNSKDREYIFTNHLIIERALKNEIVSIKDEGSLADPITMKRVLERIKDVRQSVDYKEPSISVEIPSYIAEGTGLELYTINADEELINLAPSSNLESYSILIVCNLMLKRIFLMKLDDDISQRNMFIASKSASNLNANRYKNEFTIRNVSDPLEREMLLEKVGIIQQYGV